MFKSTVDGETIEGRPLAWTDHSMYLLGRDGQLHTFDPHEAKDAKKTSPNFYGYSSQEMRQRLAKEFGNSMQITTTKHYVVVHPPGAASKWADHFEQLYRSFVAYFRVRGFQLEEPKFPLVAVVFRNKAEFERNLQESADNKGGVLLGYYTPTDNRVNTFDITADYPDQDWSRNAGTIIHEATHQTAHNVGINNRFAKGPLWLLEGLATMFEARGVWNSQTYHTLKDRVNAERYRDFQEGLKTRKPGTLGNLIASDRLFETDPKAAYAEGWALMLFLCETRPRELAAYIQKTESRPDFTEYFSTQRVADFQECFGGDLNKLEANFLSWMQQLKSTVGDMEEPHDLS
ncbi:MAG: DUF1570 domain-containing protein [Pirellulales bacterium]